MFTHILLPTDGSDLSLRGVRMGIDLARTHGAKVTGLHVIPPFHTITYVAEMLAATELTYMADAVDRAERYLAEVRQLAEAAGVPCDTEYETSDHPDEIIARTARLKQCDLVVMASHGWHGMTKLLLGSVTQKVLLTSTAPVLVCR
jgi:nucleotide-binding universal stress UspA family protein